MTQGMAWESNTDIRTLAERLGSARRIVVLTHMKPDGDALGSTLALVRTLNRTGQWGSKPRGEAWYIGPMPPWHTDVIGQTPHRILENGTIPDVGPIDAVALLDTGSWSQVEPLRAFLAARPESVCVVDHHKQGDAEIGAFRYVDVSAAAVCQPVGELCRALLSTKALTTLPPEVAEALYLGLATDTGWFRHSNVASDVMHMAADLIQAGANHVRLYQCIEQRESVTRLKLLSRALASMEILEQGRVAMMSLRLADFQESGAQPGESGGFVDYGQAVLGVVVTCLLTEAPPGESGASGAGVMTKVSLRSKPGEPDVDVNRAAQKLGGGGHVRAAGARVPMSLEACKAAVLRVLHEQTGH